MAGIFDKLDSFKKKYPKSIYTGTEVPLIKKIKFGVFVLDTITNGGIPISKATVFWGGKSSGKSTMALRVVGQYLRAHPEMKAVYIDAENTYEKMWADYFLHDVLDRFILIQPASGDEAVDIYSEVAAYDDVGFVVFDSVAGMVSSKEAEGESDDSFVAQNAKLTNKLLFKYMYYERLAARQGREFTTLFINQMRGRFGATSFSSPTKMAGGYYFSHAMSLSLKFTMKQIHKVGEVPIKSTTIIGVDKNKVGLANRTGEIVMFLTPTDTNKPGDIEDTDVIIAYAKKIGALYREGVTWYLGDKTFKNLAAVTSFLDEDLEAREVLKDIVSTALMAKPLGGAMATEEMKGE